SPAVLGPVASPSAGNPTPCAPDNCWGGRPTAPPPWNSVVVAGAGQRLVTLCPVASTSAGDSASSAPAKRWGRSLASSTPKLCSCHWGGKLAASFSIPSSGCLDDMSMVLSPRCTDLCWGGKAASSTLANCWGGTTHTSSPFSPCICCWEVIGTFSPWASETATDTAVGAGQSKVKFGPNTSSSAGGSSGCSSSAEKSIKSPISITGVWG
ncbi:hypothetical protein AB205_0109020, partial [Aquarana catesbeiana]